MSNGYSIACLHALPYKRDAISKAWRLDQRTPENDGLAIWTRALHLAAHDFFCRCGELHDTSCDLVWKRRYLLSMTFLLFLRGMLAVLVVFAVSMYFLTGSLWTAFWQTLLCAVFIQVGYFACVLFMVVRSRGKMRNPSSAQNEAGDAARTDEPSAEGARDLTGAPFSKRP